MEYLVWLSGMLLGAIGYALGYALEAFCVAYAIRKGWEMARKK